MKLSISHLAPYLPYGLKAITTKGTYKDPQVGIIDYWSKNGNVENEISISSDEGYYLCEPHELKPLLRPLSSLYKEIDGKVGIVELAKIATSIQDWEVIIYQPVFGSRKIKLKPYPIAYNKEYNFRFFHRNNDLYLYDVDGARDCTHQNQLDIFTYLFSHHYDVWNLIGQNLAIDKTKIK